jgi:antitoxin ParD1/3/4
MSKYQFTPQAVADLFEVWSFIAQDNPTAADRVEEAVYRACDFLADSPLVGRIRKELTPLPVRFWVVQPYLNYIIVYDPEKKPLQIIRIFHSARDLPSVLP